MPFPEINDFIDKVLGHVKFSYDHENIRQELQEHIEDMMDDLCGNGISEAEAVSLAVINMGNPDDIGKELNKVHNPVLGFVWFISRKIAAVIIAILLVEAVSDGYSFIRSLVDGYGVTQSKGEVVYSVKSGYETMLDDMHIKIDEVVYYDDETMEVRYITWKSPFATSIDWTFNLSTNCFYDEKGNNYFSSGGGSGPGPIFKHQMFLEDFPKTAEKLIIDYDYNGRVIYCEIPLKGRAVNGTS